MSRSRVKILIAGAGLSGLSAAFHLGQREYRIVDREARPGGLCRTERVGDYLFDYGGHLLHLRADSVRGLVRELLGGRLLEMDRRSSIYSHGVFTRYPFQVNTYGLPEEVVLECLDGIRKARAEAAGAPEPSDFESWVLYHFGPGFARHFFFPFNRKFFKMNLREMDTEWAQWSIPRPTLAEAEAGATAVSAKAFGYNARFFYPKGGIEELPKALTAGLSRPVETGVEVVGLDPAERLALLSTGEEVKYGRMISSLPLRELLRRCRNLPEELAPGRDLDCLSVRCRNLGLEGQATTTDQHWIYFPEERFPFHRVGVYSNIHPIGPDLVSLYLETTFRGAGVIDVISSSDPELDGLRSTPLWSESGRLVSSSVMNIDYGYVVYDERRRRLLPRALTWLAGCGVECVGRYGRWEYAAMEDALIQGREAAERITGGRA